MRTVFVTGGAGFIGSCLVRQLVHDDCATVVNLDKLTYAGNLDSLGDLLRHPRHRFVKGDIGDADLVTRLLDEHQPCGVINLAAESHVDRSIDAPAAFVETNVLGTCRFLHVVRGYWNKLSETERARFRFVQVSTDEVYGSMEAGQSANEGTLYAPNSPYSASKAAADHFVRAYQHTYGLPTIITHCSNNYGPRQFPEKLLPLVILNAVDGKPLPIYGDGQNVRDWLYVEDHCRALRRVLERGVPSETYNIGGNSERTNIEIVRDICAIVDQLCRHLPRRPCASLITYVKDRPGHDRRYAIDAGKIERELGWRPRQSLAAGLHRTVEWYLRNQTWVERVTSGKSRRERLGLSGPVSLPSSFSAGAAPQPV